MSQHQFLMTEQGLNALKEESQALETVKRPKAVQRVKHARSFCDFQEDSEYEASVEELSKIDKRIAELKYIIQQAEILQPNSHHQVELGSTVTFQEVATDEDETYMIVGKEEADPAESKISHNSPVAQSLLGAKLNDHVMLETPIRKREVIITDISN